MISIVIPAYNESDNILHTIEEIEKVLSEAQINYEIFVIDDHSKDDTFDKIHELQNKKIRCIRLSRRGGSFNALRAGMQYIQGDAFIGMSADGQDDPSVLLEMIDKWKKGSHIVWAYRKDVKRKNEPIHIKLPALIFYRILNLMVKNTDFQVDMSRADFVLIDRKVISTMNACHEKNTSLWGLLAWSGFSQSYVEYDRKERRAGVSKWDFSQRMNYAKDWIISFSALPLRSVIWIGSIIGAIGFVYALFIFISHFFYGHYVEGWSSLMIVILILGGMNLSMMGVLGEYLWRNLEESRRRPNFIVEKDTLSVGNKIE